jgi:hypothetical protein
MAITNATIADHAAAIPKKSRRVAGGWNRSLV